MVTVVVWIKMFPLGPQIWTLGPQLISLYVGFMRCVLAGGNMPLGLCDTSCSRSVPCLRLRMSSQLPHPAAAMVPAMMDSYSSGSISQNKLSLLSAVWSCVCHSHCKGTAAVALLGDFLFLWGTGIVRVGKELRSRESRQILKETTLKVTINFKFNWLSPKTKLNCEQVTTLN